MEARNSSQSCLPRCNLKYPFGLLLISLVRITPTIVMFVKIIITLKLVFNITIFAQALKLTLELPKEKAQNRPLFGREALNSRTLKIVFSSL